MKPTDPRNHDTWIVACHMWFNNQSARAIAKRLGGTAFEWESIGERHRWPRRHLMPPNHDARAEARAKAQQAVRAIRRAP